MRATNIGNPTAANPAHYLIANFARAGAGFAIIVMCLEAGIFLQHRLRLPIPGNLLGMILLLGLLQAEIVPDAWVHGPCAWLLLLLPAFFVPIYVMPLSDPDFWLHYGTTLVPAAIVGVALTLGVTGGLARWVRRL